MLNSKTWTAIYSKEAKKDLEELDNSKQIIVRKAIKKVKQNPLPQTKGGYGIPLGNKHGFNLTNCCEIKLRGQGIRVIYKLIKDEMVMLNIAIDRRSDFEAYKLAFERLKNMQD